jgi:hypothetical protein
MTALKPGLGLNIFHPTISAPRLPLIISLSSPPSLFDVFAVTRRSLFLVAESSSFPSLAYILDPRPRPATWCGRTTALSASVKAEPVDLLEFPPLLCHNQSNSLPIIAVQYSLRTINRQAPSYPRSSLLVYSALIAPFRRCTSISASPFFSPGGVGANKLLPQLAATLVRSDFDTLWNLLCIHFDSLTTLVNPV